MSGNLNLKKKCSSHEYKRQVHSKETDEEPIVPFFIIDTEPKPQDNLDVPVYGKVWTNLIMMIII